MAFNSLTLGAESYVSIGNGLYQLSTVPFGGAGKMIKLAPGNRSAKTLVTTASVTRILEKDITVGTTVVRRKAVITSQLVIPDGFTSAEVALLMSSTGTGFFTTANVDRLLQGEN